jgi:hypothetical protein
MRSTTLAALLLLCGCAAPAYVTEPPEGAIAVAVVDPATGQQLIGAEGEPLFTPTNTGLLGGALALLGVFMRGRKKEKESDGRVDHERLRRKEVESRIEAIERGGELAAAHAAGAAGRPQPPVTATLKAT